MHWKRGEPTHCGNHYYIVSDCDYRVSKSRGLGGKGWLYSAWQPYDEVEHWTKRVIRKYSLLGIRKSRDAARRLCEEAEARRREEGEVSAA